MNQILLTNKAIKDLEKLEPVIKERIGNKLAILKSDPFINSKKLTNPVLGTYRARVGDYRIIFDIDHENIIVLRIGHRKDIYK